MHSNIQLSTTLETNNQISFLDIFIIRKSQQLEIDNLENLPRLTPPSFTYLITPWNKNCPPTDITLKEC